MPNRFQRNSIGELVCRVPLQRGSLLKSIENLVKTIETSENAVMIPTLLRDKVRIDAWELLFVAKILKASILGHDDLVEFYMNHIHQNGLSTSNASNGGQSAAQTPNALLLNGQLTPNGYGSPALSPSLARQQSSPSMASPLLMSHPVQINGLGHNRQSGVQLKEQTEPIVANSSAASSTSSNYSSQTTSSTTTTTTTGGIVNNQTGPTATNSKSSSSSTSWTTAVSQQPQQQPGGSAAASLTSGSPFNSAASSLSSTGHQAPLATGPIGECPTPVTISSQESNGGSPLANPLKVLSSSISCDELVNQQQPLQPANLAGPPSAAQDGGLLAARPLMSRLAQPPSLLQLTTTNNHINSVSELLSSSPMDPSLDSLSQHLISLQQQQQQASSTPTTTATNNNLDLGAGLSLTIPTGSSSISNGLTPGEHPPAPPSFQAATPTPARHELRSSRSAGCLFRANSGASSPRTPATPYPQAETLAGAANPNGLVGDPTSLVKLLLQVEQLKASIVHVNTLLESVVDLYKKSIDNISQ